LAFFEGAMRRTESSTRLSVENLRGMAGQAPLDRMTWGLGVNREQRGLANNSQLLVNLSSAKI
jgi:hypothetical protein